MPPVHGLDVFLAVLTGTVPLLTPTGDTGSAVAAAGEGHARGAHRNVAAHHGASGLDRVSKYRGVTV